MKRKNIRDGADPNVSSRQHDLIDELKSDSSVSEPGACVIIRANQRARFHNGRTFFTSS